MRVTQYRLDTQAGLYESLAAASGASLQTKNISLSAASSAVTGTSQPCVLLPVIRTGLGAHHPLGS